MHPAFKPFPPEFIARIEKIIPMGLLKDAAHGYAAERPTTLRVNTLLADEAAVTRDLAKNGVIVEAVTGIPGAFRLKEGSRKKLDGSRAYGEGWIYLQSLSSQIPPLVLAPRPGESVLDMAAAPGGKTCQMAALMKNRGELVAVEPDTIRCERLRYNIAKQKVAIATVIQGRGEKLGEEHVGRYDRVLLDAPCSSEGTFLARARGSFSHWSEEFVRKTAVLQKKLMTVALACLKPGGTLVYATCALSPEENEAVVAHALLSCSGLVTLDVVLKNPFLRPALAAWNGEAFPSGVAKARRIYPSPQMEGFFVCMLRKPG